MNVDYKGTVLDDAVGVANKFAEKNSITKITHLVMEESAKTRLSLYGVNFFPHFVVIAARSNNARCEVLLNDEFNWEAIRRLEACTKETVASRSAKALFIAKEDVVSVARYLKYRARLADIDEICGDAGGMSLRDFLRSKKFGKHSA